LNEQNEHLQEENKQSIANIDALNEEMEALQSEIYKNKRSNDSNDEIIHKMQDILQILYRELKPNKDAFDNPSQISNAFKEWKRRERMKYQNNYMDEQPLSERDSHRQIDVESTACQQNTAWMSSFFSYFKDF